jgi:hypothetical protein
MNHETLPVLSEDDWQRTVSYNNRELTEVEFRDDIRRRSEPAGPGSQYGDTFEEVTAEGDGYSHGRDVDAPRTWCARRPTGILPKPTGIWCPDCVGHHGMN